jgi:energy-coupling factor transporter transmembrane protein EcfT
MAYPVTPWQYRPGRSLLHGASPLVKLVLFLVTSGVSFTFPPWGAVCAVVLFLTGALLSKINPLEFFHGIRFLLPIFAMILAFRSFNLNTFTFNPEGLKEALYLIWGMMTAFAGTSLFFSVTTRSELYEALSLIEGKITRRKSGSFAGRSLSLALSLMLGFFPRFFFLWEEKDCAFRARAGRGVLKRLALLGPLVEAMLETAKETAAALETRGVLL